MSGARSLAALRMLLAALLLAASATFAQAPVEFRDAAEEARFRALTVQLRCVMCQNQSLADSDAQIARDLRAQVLELMRRGLSDDQIKAWLVERYGDFVLYEPPVKPGTWLLWFGPALILLAGAGVVVAIVRRRGAALPPAAADEGQEW
jgi:cytochrome c-type biogenesis protein CcmH